MKWGYMDVLCPIQGRTECLKEFGGKGWELATGIPMTIPPQPIMAMQDGKLVKAGMSPPMDGILFFFKRPLTATEPTEAGSHDENGQQQSNIILAGA